MSVPVRRTFIAVAAVAAVSAGGYVVAGGTGLASTPDGAGSASSTASPEGSTTSEPVSTEPPADVATDAPVVPVVPVLESRTDDPADPTGDPADEPTGRADVFLSVVEWDAASSAVEAGGYVSGVLEMEGRCTLTLSSRGRTRTATSAAEPDATTMSCGSLSVPGSELSSGTWTAVLGYASATARGESDPFEVDVP